MAATSDHEEMAALAVFVGRWRMTTSLAPDGVDPPRAVTTFEWLSGERFLIQRWEVEHPDAPDGIAVIGFDRDRATYVQHYFDARGVARTYDMGLDDGVWTLHRTAAPPDFSQRFTGRFSDDGGSIAGRWELSRDGSTWVDDFDLAYVRAT